MASTKWLSCAGSALTLVLAASPALAQQSGRLTQQKGGQLQRSQQAQACKGQQFDILQPMATHITTITDPTTKKQSHYIPIMLDKVRWGYLPNADSQPILTIASGNLVTFDTVSHEGILEDQGRDPAKYFARAGIPADRVLDDAKAVAGSDIQHDFVKDGPHVITGPVAVEGAQPGDVLKVDIISVVPRVPYGVISNRHGKGALVGEYPQTPAGLATASVAHPEEYHNVSIVTPVCKVNGTWYGFIPDERGRELRIPIHPFPGTLGVAPNTKERTNSVPPGSFGGNLDLNDLTAGATLYVPVQVPGALFFTGDPHFAQGDGEIALTALEGSMRITYRLTLLKKGGDGIPGGSLDQPFAETEHLWIPIGLSENLGDAMKNAVRQAIKFLSNDKRPALTHVQAMAYLSAATDFHVTEVVDKVLGIHAHIHKADFPGTDVQQRAHPH